MRGGYLFLLSYNRHPSSVFIFCYKRLPGYVTTLLNCRHCACMYDGGCGGLLLMCYCLLSIHGGQCKVALRSLAPSFSIYTRQVPSSQQLPSMSVNAIYFDWSLLWAVWVQRHHAVSPLFIHPQTAMLHGARGAQSTTTHWRRYRNTHTHTHAVTHTYTHARACTRTKTHTQA